MRSFWNLTPRDKGKGYEPFHPERAPEAKGYGHLQVLELDLPTRTALEAAKAVGAEVGQIVKSLVFPGSRGYLFLISGKNRLDLAKAQALSGRPSGRGAPRRFGPSPGPRWPTSRGRGLD